MKSDRMCLCGEISARKLAKMFNVSRGDIRGVIKNRTWKGAK